MTNESDPYLNEPDPIEYLTMGRERLLDFNAHIRLSSCPDWKHQPKIHMEAIRLRLTVLLKERELDEAKKQLVAYCTPPEE